VSEPDDYDPAKNARTALPTNSASTSLAKLRAAILFGQQMALSEAALMLAQKTQRTLSMSRLSHNWRTPNVTL